MSWSWVDIVLAVILVVTLILGFLKGLVRQVIGIMAVVAGLVLAALYYLPVAGFLNRFIAEAKWSLLPAFLVIFIGVLMAGWLVALVLSKLMKGPLKFMNHILGGVFGLLKGVLICGVIVLGLLVFQLNRSTLEKSILAPYCFGVSKALVHLIPQELKAKFKTAYQEFVENVKKRGNEV